MATTGALNGTNVFLRVHDGSQWLSVGGQLSHTETLTNTLLDVTNKIGSGDFRELLPDEAMQSVDYSVEVVFVSQAGYDFVRTLAGNKGQATFQVLSGPVAGGTVETQLTGQISNFADTSTTAEPLKGTFNILSSDSFEWAMGQEFELFVPSGSDSFVTSDGNTFYVRA